MAGFGIQQSFPRNGTYCCHSPSLSLKCEFPPGVSLVLWSIPDKRITNIPATYLDHMIDNSKMSEGFSELTVSDVSSLEARYGCIVYFPNGSSIDYDKKSHPPQHGKCATPTCPACTSRQDNYRKHISMAYDVHRKLIWFSAYCVIQLCRLDNANRYLYNIGLYILSHQMG